MKVSDFNQRDYDVWNTFAIHVFSQWITNREYTIITTEEDYGADVKTKNKKGEQVNFELGVRKSPNWSTRENFPYRKPNFPNRKMRYEDDDFFILQICPCTLAFYGAKRSEILEHGELRENVPTKRNGIDGADDYWYMDKDDLFWGTLLLKI